MSFEHFERGYLLPKGCKDLIDAINLHATPQPKIFDPASVLPKHQSTMKGDLLVPEHTTVRQLAALLGQKPFEIIADAMELGVFPNVNQPLAFETIAKITRKYGYTSRQTA